MIISQKYGYDIAYDYKDITEFLNKYTDTLDAGSIVDKLRVLFIPYWVFEYHAGIDKGNGWLNAIDSKLEIDKKHIELLTTNIPKSIDDVLKQEKYQLIDEFVLEPTLTERAEADKIVHYKIPLLTNKQNVIITKLQLVYIPFWEITTIYNKKSKIFLANGLDRTEFEKILLPYIEDELKPKEDTSESAVFSGVVSDFFNPKKFILNLAEAVIFIFTPVLKFLRNCFKMHFWISSIVFIVLLILIYFAIA